MKVSFFALALLLALLLPNAFAQTTSPYYHKITNLQQQKGWNGYALLSPSWSICSSCSPTSSSVNWSRTPGISSPSVSGSSTKHHIGGTRSFSDILWNNHIIGSFSSQGILDASHTLVPNLHHFIYEAYFYAKNIGASQALEFDINQFTGGKSFIWGHECRIAGGHEWDTYDNVHKKWVSTGIPCNPVNNAWNHLVIEVARTSGNQLLFKTITLNGKAHTLNITRSPNSTSWHAVTINYQQDGNQSQTDYSIWLDRLNFTYW
jgi:hypothetical protein